MCATCGCSAQSRPRLIDLENGLTIDLDESAAHEHHHHEHTHAHTHSHGHEHSHQHGTTISLEAAVLAKNDRLAEQNRGWFAGRDILALNLVSSPGAGKTTLLERTLRELGAELTFAVIEGDQETTRDAERIRATGCRGGQAKTGGGRHL